MIMLLATLPLCTTALAQDEFAGAEAPPEEVVAKESKTNLSAELGGQWTTGNAQLYTLSAGIGFSARWDKNKISAGAGAITGGAVPDSNGNGFLDEVERDEGFIENARRVFGDVRLRSIPIRPSEPVCARRRIP